ncbi:MAG: hypothetical protein K9M57_00905 [Phycisphaerae bacterium]|nr:hypothetical protein [Phycisphaerae bacterium]
MSEPLESYWIFIIDVRDCAGALTSVASAFSNKEVNIDKIIGHGQRNDSDDKGQIIVGFNQTEERKDIMARKIKRLPKVIKLREEEANPERLIELITQK